MKHPSEKIISYNLYSNTVKIWKEQKQNIVFTNGCFDILHRGHIDYLYKAKELGTFLVVGVNSDNSVKLLNKGIARPLQNEQSRAEILASLYFVDAVMVFEEATPIELIKIIQPDVLVKGGDYKIEDIVGYDVVKEKSGIITTIPFLEGYSTTAIENKIIKSID